MSEKLLAELRVNFVVLIGSLHPKRPLGRQQADKQLPAQRTEADQVVGNAFVGQVLQSLNVDNLLIKYSEVFFYSGFHFSG